MNTKASHILILTIAIMAISAAAFLRLDQYTFNNSQPRCPLKNITGIKCALCGMTRSFTAIGHGNLAQSFGFHTIGPALFAIILLQIPYRIRAIIIHPRQTAALTKKIHLAIVMTVMGAIVVNWLIYLKGLL